MLNVDFNVENICIGQTDRQTDRLHSCMHDNVHKFYIRVFKLLPMTQPSVHTVYIMCITVAFMTPE